MEKKRIVKSIIFYVVAVVVFLLLLTLMLLTRCNVIGLIVLTAAFLALGVVRHFWWGGFKTIVCWLMVLVVGVGTVPLTNTISLQGSLESLYKRYVYAPSVPPRDPNEPVEKSADIWDEVEGMTLSQFQYNNMDMKFLEANDGNGKVVLQFHGGAYVYPLNKSFEKMAVRYSDICGGADVLTFDYRVAPENPYPAALDDAVSAYRWLLNNGYACEDIIFIGDSAGGGLALATCLYLRDNQMPLPLCIITESAWTNLNFDGESVETNKEKDPGFYEGSPLTGDLIDSTYIGTDSAYNPYISPVYGDFTGFPPMLMQAGENERLLSDTTDVAVKAESQGVQVQCTVYSQMYHEFQVDAPEIPESQKAFEEMREFVSQL